MQYSFLDVYLISLYSNNYQVFVFYVGWRNHSAKPYDYAGLRKPPARGPWLLVGGPLHFGIHYFIQLGKCDTQAKSLELSIEIHAGDNPLERW